MGTTLEQTRSVTVPHVVKAAINLSALWAQMLHYSFNVVHIRHTYGVPMAGQRFWDILANKKGRKIKVRERV